MDFKKWEFTDGKAKEVISGFGICAEQVEEREWVKL
jgi:hypothetical protein